ncbi:MAG: glycosyltransferase [Nitrospira sp. CR1.3]|nr:glycosyltransferase [Nitrospira sp. CR1.3]
MISAGKSVSSNGVVSEHVFQSKDRAIFLILTLLGLGAIVFFLSSWFRLPAWGTHPFSMVVLFAILSALLVNHLARWWVLRDMVRPLPVPARSGWKVAVVTTFVPRLEPLEMLERTLSALVAMDYPHDTWVLDEEDDDRVRQLCESTGAIHFSRKRFPHYQTEVGTYRKASKHGNYNAWLHEIGFNRYEILAAFDPDHVPEPNFLSRVLGFFESARVGYVQAPQVYANQQASFIARGAAEETYEFFSSVQMACYAKGFPLIIGCHNTHRLSALRECGGFASHDADDLLLTLLYQSRGWHGVYVPEILARGLAPVDWPTYLNQQRRWTRSVLDIKLRIGPIVARNLSPAAMFLNVLHGLNYVHRSIVLPVAMILVAMMLLSGDIPVVATSDTMIGGGLTILVLEIWEWFRQRFYLGGKFERGFHWRAWLVQFAKWPYQIAAFADVIFKRQFPYVTTPKSERVSHPVFVLWPHLITLIVTASAWLIGRSLHGTPPVALQLCGGAIMVVTLGLMITEWIERSGETGEP